MFVFGRVKRFFEITAHTDAPADCVGGNVVLAAPFSKCYGTLNVCGKKIARLRKAQKISQRALADKLQLHGIDLSKNAVQQIESGERFVTDIELKAFAELFSVTADILLESH